jgi:PTS system galactitol-specific IIA component
MDINELLNNGDILHMEAVNFQDFGKQIFPILLSRHEVTEKYLAALFERESKYPTGIMLPKRNIALPHVDAKYICTNALYIINLENQILFRRIDDFEKEIEVSLIFLLLIKDPALQVHAIASLTKLWQNEELLQRISSSHNKDEVMDYIKKEVI